MKFDISAAFVILVALILASYIGMSTSSSGICFVARARANNTNDSFGIPSISKQTLEGQKQIDESGLLAWQTFGQRSKDKNRFVMN